MARLSEIRLASRRDRYCVRGSSVITTPSRDLAPRVQYDALAIDPYDQDLSPSRSAPHDQWIDSLVSIDQPSQVSASTEVIASPSHSQPPTTVPASNRPFRQHHPDIRERPILQQQTLPRQSDTVRQSEPVSPPSRQPGKTLSSQAIDHSDSLAISPAIMSQRRHDPRTYQYAPSSRSPRLASPLQHSPAVRPLREEYPTIHGICHRLPA